MNRILKKNNKYLTKFVIFKKSIRFSCGGEYFHESIKKTNLVNYPHNTIKADPGSVTNPIPLIYLNSI